MKRASILAILLSFSPGLCAQQPQQPREAEATAPAAAAQSTDSGERNAEPLGTPASIPTAAPKPGHPLDPHDVDVLTGKADREARASRGTVYVSPGGYGYGQSAVGGMGVMRTRPFSPGVFGNANGSRFFFFGSRPFTIFPNFFPPPFGNFHGFRIRPR